MQRLVLHGTATLAVALALGGAAATTAGAASTRQANRAAAANGITFFANPGKRIVCRYSSFSGFQELKCEDRSVAAEDGGPFTARLHKTGRGEQTLMDPNPIERVGSTVARFTKAPFACTLTKAAVRCVNPTRHGFLLTPTKGSVF